MKLIINNKKNDRIIEANETLSNLYNTSFLKYIYINSNMKLYRTGFYNLK